jgi:hypothetical protein
MVTRMALTCLITFNLICCAFAQGQSSAALPATTPPANATAADAGRIVRDPTTGKTYYQQWITETVPVVRWENKQVTTTVNETQWVNTVVPTTQTVYQPQVQQVPQAYWQGAWNPFQQPTLAYQYVPVTNWIPQTVTVNQVVPRQQVVPKQQTITVPQQVTETKTQQRLIQTEIPQTTPTIALSNQQQPRGTYTANQPPRLLNIPLLARQPFAPPANYQASQSASSGASSWARPAQTSQFVAAPNSGFRPVTRLFQSVLPAQNYSAPMMTATARGGDWNVMQNGMQPTVLR